ncbi:potassium uptake protein, TrkH family [Rubidibacter lacunae KORDI 51-2]|uniref:Potassium uptake protein, TrkH family n=1 Tax=Rubidibacter lacunae KORDI 51-2 TaxID=582515 RepID=U5DIM4_9CHRO|nr:TrkH family potassium uptake protein [Rubidibacter lacunae]ERN40444.1 potassium uptake protein, TrkH family [Rubidibacter lacunae KORDI 51-2]
MTIARSICVGFLGTILLGTLLLLLPGSTVDGGFHPLIALFTSTSAVCVTGLAVVDTGTYFTFWGQLVILLLIQVGGLGYMTTNTFLLILIGRRVDLRQRVALQESFERPFGSGSRSLIRAIVWMTVIFELTGTIALLPLFADADLPLWQALFHSISAWNNAGFSLFPDSLTQYRGNAIANLVVPLLIISGGLGYQILLELFGWTKNLVERRQSRYGFSMHFKVATSTTVTLLVLGTLAFLLVDATGPQVPDVLSLPEKFLAAWFQSVTTRTAGFNTLNIGQLTDATLFIIISFMFVGASPGGTGGGIKTTTLRILLGSARSTLRGDSEVVMYERRLPVATILKAVAVLCGSALVAIGTTVLLAFLNQNMRFIDLLFESVSAFATVGLSTGITSQVTPLSQLVLVATMYVGRVGVLVFVSAILGDSHPTAVKYPEENLLVG